MLTRTTTGIVENKEMAEIAIVLSRIGTNKAVISKIEISNAIFRTSRTIIETKVCPKIGGITKVMQAVVSTAEDMDMPRLIVEHRYETADGFVSVRVLTSLTQSP